MVVGIGCEDGVGEEIWLFVFGCGFWLCGGLFACGFRIFVASVLFWCSWLCRAWTRFSGDG